MSVVLRSQSVLSFLDPVHNAYSGLNITVMNGVNDEHHVTFGIRESPTTGVRRKRSKVRFYSCPPEDLCLYLQFIAAYSPWQICVLRSGVIQTFFADCPASLPLNASKC